MRTMMTISIQNKDQSQPMVYSGVDNTYIKEGFYCLVFRKENRVMKWPVANIFRIIEPYDARVENNRDKHSWLRADSA